MNYTIDASVFIASARASEPHHVASLDFLNQLKAQQPDVFCPSLILAECGASLARRTGDPALAFRLVSLVKNFVGMRLIPLSLSRADDSARIAINHRLRGADSVYASVAEEFTATIVTWDDEMLKRTPAGVKTQTPQQWLDEQ